MLKTKEKNETTLSKAQSETVDHKPLIVAKEMDTTKVNKMPLNENQVMKKNISVVHGIDLILGN